MKQKGTLNKKPAKYIGIQICFRLSEKDSKKIIELAKLRNEQPSITARNILEGAL
jgi:hypothetical protein